MAERLYLSKKGFKPELKQTAKQLKFLIDNNGYKNDRTLAGFIARKYEEIEQLIPKNKAYETQITTLRMAIEQGKGYVA